jgi:hypothetical protein
MTITDVKYYLTDEEIKDLAQELAAHIRHFGNVQKEKKVAMAEFKSELEGINDQIQKISGTIMNGYELRTIECEVKVDYTTNQRTYIDPNTGAIIKAEDMDTPQPSIFDEDADDIEEADFHLLPAHEEVQDD